MINREISLQLGRTEKSKLTIYVHNKQQSFLFRYLYSLWYFSFEPLHTCFFKTKVGFQAKPEVMKNYVAKIIC